MKINLSEGCKEIAQKKKILLGVKNEQDSQNNSQCFKTNSKLLRSSFGSYACVLTVKDF